MPAMLPVPALEAPSLADVVPSSIAALRGEANVLGLTEARGVVIVLVDGLGASALRSRAGHARRIVSVMGRRDVIQTVFPSTTAAALASLSTGVWPGEHGMVGYQVLDRGRDRVVGLLNGWDQTMSAAEWQSVPTRYESAGPDVDCVAIGPRRYEATDFSAAVLRGTRYVAAETLQDRFARARTALQGPSRSLVYLYVPELDQIAHAHGWESEKWTAALEEVDSEVGRFSAGLGAHEGLLVTADHGIVDVPSHRHVLVDEIPGLLAGVRHVGGEPRCLQLYLEDGEDAERHAARWRTQEGARAWVATKAEAIAAGWFGPVVQEAAVDRIGDVLVAARKGVAYYDRGRSEPRSLQMVGQHGSFSDEERRIPLARFGVFAREG